MQEVSCSHLEWYLDRKEAEVGLQVAPMGGRDDFKWRHVRRTA